MCEECDKLQTDMARDGVIMRVYDEAGKAVVTLHADSRITFDSTDEDSLRAALRALSEQALELIAEQEKVMRRRHYADVMIGALLVRVPPPTPEAKDTPEESPLQGGINVFRKGTA